CTVRPPRTRISSSRIRVGWARARKNWALKVWSSVAMSGSAAFFRDRTGVTRTIILEYCYAIKRLMPLTRGSGRLGAVLPAQVPISIFIHHNPLHAFEHLPFEEAVERAAVQLGREPFLAEARYRDKLASGRILVSDVEALRREQLGVRGEHDVAGAGRPLLLWLGRV